MKKKAKILNIPPRSPELIEEMKRAEAEGCTLQEYRLLKAICPDIDDYGEVKILRV